MHSLINITLLNLEEWPYDPHSIKPNSISIILLNIIIKTTLSVGIKIILQRA